MILYLHGRLSSDSGSGVIKLHYGHQQAVIFLPGFANRIIAVYQLYTLVAGPFSKNKGCNVVPGKKLYRPDSP